MRLGVKHQNQFQIVHADFSGGLNTDTNQLRTVAGTVIFLTMTLKQKLSAKLVPDNGKLQYFNGAKTRDCPH